MMARNLESRIVKLETRMVNADRKMTPIGIMGTPFSPLISLSWNDGTPLQIMVETPRRNTSPRGIFMALNITLIFKATAEQLFAAWTEPEIVRQWLFKGAHGESVTADIDLAVGRFSILEQTKDGTVDHFGNYIAIDKPHSLAFTLEAPKRFGGVSEVQVEFKQMSEECEMVFQQTGVDTKTLEASWRRMFINLTMTLIKR